MRTPAIPPLPRALADPRPVIAVGTVGWAVAFVVSGVLALTGRAGLGNAVLSCAVGLFLGVLGYGIFYWQRRTSRRDVGRGQSGLS